MNIPAVPATPAESVAQAGALVASAAAAPEVAVDTAGPRALSRSRAALVFIAVLLVLYTCYLAQDLIVPVMVAIFLALCGNPIVTRLNKLKLPRWMGALGVVIGGLIVGVVLASALLSPAVDWLHDAPNELRQHIPKLRALTKPFQDVSTATESLQELAEGGGSKSSPMRVMERGDSSLVSLLTSAPRTLGSALAVTILWYFFMVYAEDLLRRFVTVMPGWRRKRVTVDILRSIQIDISRYVLTVTAINTCLGIATALALFAIGLPWDEALLWGAVAGVFNFAPYIGPLIAALSLCLVGLVHFPTLGQAFIPPATFLFLHLIEGQVVTPLILGKRMAISPVILLLWLFLWGWMWGIFGLLLAVPMLVCFKIYCSRIDGLRSWALMMEP